MTSITSVSVSIDAADATYSLREPVVVGGVEVSKRDYTLLRVTGNTGKHGYAYGISRGLPIARIIERVVGPAAIGVEAESPSATCAAVLDRLGPLATDTSVLRAMSLLDIALWDLRGHEAEAPVCELLGSTEENNHKVIVVEGYMPASGEISEVRKRVEEALDNGQDLVKFSSGPDAETTKATIGAVLPEALIGEAAAIVDPLWSLGSLSAGRAISKALDDIRVDWLEDPFPGQLLKREEYRATLSQRVAYGDEATDPVLLDDLMGLGRVDVLRVDATTIGGLTGAMSVIQRAHQQNIPVSCHIYPEVHQHLAFSESAAEFLEFFPLDGRYDAANQFRTRSVLVEGPTFARPTEPGLGVGIDWSEVGRTAHTMINVRRNSGLEEQK